MSGIRRLWAAHPNLVSWLLLAIGMVIIVVIAARNVGFKPGQWAALLTATVLLAGLCVWIIGWEERDDAGPKASTQAEGSREAPPEPEARETVDPR